MPIDVNETSSTIEGALHFSGKWLNVPVYTPRSVATPEICTCLSQCVPALPAFTDEIGTDFYKNDKFRISINPVLGTDIDLKIVSQSGAEWAVTNNTYGVRTSLSDFYSYYFDFYKIWNQLGYGSYRFELYNKTVGGAVLQSDVSPWFRLTKFAEKTALNTVRIETVQSGKLFNSINYKGLFAGAKYPQQIRFRGSLIFSGQIVENSGYQLNDPNRTRLQVKDQLLPEYTLTLHQVSSVQVARAMYDYLMANSVAVTNYNPYVHSIDPRNWNTEQLRSIPLKVVENSFNANYNAIRRTYSFKMEYDQKNIFKINS